MNFRVTAEVKGHVYGVINGQIYEFPVFTEKIMHAQTVCTRPFLLLPLKKGPGDEVSLSANRLISYY